MVFLRGYDLNKAHFRSAATTSPLRVELSPASGNVEDDASTPSTGTSQPTRTDTSPAAPLLLPSSTTAAAPDAPQSSDAADAKERADAFRQVFDTNGWGSSESRSGGGSELAYTVRLRPWLAQQFRSLNISRLLDAPCGDFNWQHAIPNFRTQLTRYIGCDIVPATIERARARAASLSLTNTQFLSCDFVSQPISAIVTDPARALDAILCRHAIQHLTISDGQRALRNFKQSGVRYLITTTWYPHRDPGENAGDPGESNAGTHSGGWYPNHLEAPPFGLSEPIVRFMDSPDAVIEKHPGQFIAIWDLKTTTFGF